MTYDFTLALKLFWEFFKIGLFAIGGGPATLPYLMELTERFDWFSLRELTDMLAVSESTPGPLGINMATYAGFKALGVPGGVIATMGLVVPSIIVITIIAAYFNKMNKNERVQAAFKGVRPAVTAVIGAAVFNLCRVSLFTAQGEAIAPIWKTIILSAAVLALLQVKKLKALHPSVWFIFGAAIGIVFLF